MRVREEEPYSVLAARADCGCCEDSSFPIKRLIFLSRDAMQTLLLHVLEVVHEGSHTGIELHRKRGVGHAFEHHRTHVVKRNTELIKGSSKSCPTSKFVVATLTGTGIGSGCQRLPRKLLLHHW